MKHRRSIVLVLLLVALIPYSVSEFAEYPVNISLLIGSETEAVFRCRHQSLEAIIVWSVNRSSVGLFSDITPGFTRENGSLVSTLTIPARSKYNGTEVMCEALFRNGSLPAVTPPVTLTIIAVTLETMTTTVETMETPITTAMAATTVMTTEESTTVTLAERTTTIPKPTSSDTSFVQVPSPPLVIVSLEERYTYMCNNSETNRIYWRVNNSRLSVDIFPVKIVPDIIPLPNGHTLHTLTIGGLPEHNETTIQCVAEFMDRSVEETPVVTFLMQGLLQRVSNVTRNFTIIMWDAPFSLNLTNVEPDIVYCVEVYNITCGRSLLISECDMIETSYTNDALLPRYIYEYAVTPRSNVEDSENGTCTEVTEEFYVLKLSSEGHEFTLLDDTENRTDTIMVTIHLDIQDTQSLKVQILADSYAISLNSLDGENNGMELVPNIDSINESSVVLQFSLLYRRLWSYTVLAHGCDEHPVTEATVLSTHDIQDVSITSPLPGKIRVTGYFIEGSTVTGVIIAIPSKSGITFYSLSRDGRQLELDNTISDVEGGQHSMSTFVVDDDGLPVNRAAAIPQIVTVEKGGDNQNLSIEYEFHPNSTHVCISCTFLDSSTTDCVVVVHQRISQLSSSGLMNIESSHKFTRIGDTTYGCIEGINLEQYQIGVMDGVIREQPTIESTKNIASPGSPSSLEWAVAVAVVLVLLVLVISIAVLLVFLVAIKLKEKNRQSDHSFNNPLPESPLSPHESKENVYYLHDKDHESISLLQTEPDGSNAPATQQTQEESTLGPEQGLNIFIGTASAFPVSRIEADSSTVVYTEIKVSSSGNTPLPPATEEVVYDEIKGYKNEHGDHYAMLAASDSGGKAPDNDPLEVVYSEINPKSEVTPTEKHSINQSTPVQQDAPSPTPLTMDHLLTELIPHASKWQPLGEALSLDEYRLDEIYTNNETDEVCLQEMLELYLARPDLDHSWEEIQEAVKKIGEVLTKVISSDVEVRKEELEKNQHEESLLPGSETKDLKGSKDEATPSHSIQ